MRLKVDQHIYGKTKDKDFSTLAISVAIPKEDLKILEKHSLYQLPSSLLYDTEAKKPKKYVYYKLNNESVVLGRGIDVGRDEFGRVGNFLFHNLIFKIKDLEKSGLTPIGLIRYLEEKGIFHDKPFQEGQILPLDVEIDNSIGKEIPSVSLLEGKIDLLSTLLYACFNQIEITAPIWIYGTENETFDFLDKLFSILPKRLWSNISFNTFWSEDHKLPGLFFCCNSLKSSEIRLPNYSLKIDLAGGSYDSKINIQDKIKYEYARFIAQKVLENKEDISILYSLEESVITHDWKRFIGLYKDSSQDIKMAIYKHDRDSIMAEVSKGNISLLNVIREDISKEDQNRIFKTKELIHCFIKDRDENLTKDFVGWFYDFLAIEDKKDFYPVFLRNSWLLGLLLGKIKEEKMRTDKNIKILQGLIEGIYKGDPEHQRYDEKLEEMLLEVFCKLFESGADMNMGDILKVIKKLPPSKNTKVLLLRALIKYRLGDGSELISFVKEEKYQQLIYELLNNGVKTIDWEEYKRAFQEKERKHSIFSWRK